MGSKQSVDTGSEDRLTLAESRVDDIFEYRGNSFWEFGWDPDSIFDKSDCSLWELGRQKPVEMEFPPPTDININMMPFVFGDKNSIPSEYHGYLPLIESCWGLKGGQICYLTIQESLVKKDTSQRRAGLHIETPGSFENLHPKHRLGGGRSTILAWGKGAIAGRLCLEGIYMSSTVSDSCRVFNCRIREDKLTEPGIVRSHGDVSHFGW
eukprot:TRINITY_DN1026_c0_g1_i12.p1 TRINITY_DN1026_c0_g1~~TRINITY_DN1026_c0_g1_i12.p1  ORF type:complete len:209 (+),score=30.39 TRINITY_DN1026_c0_g1_i12:703-1329(+)